MNLQEALMLLDDCSVTIFEEGNKNEAGRLLTEDAYLVHDWDDRRGDIHSLEEEPWYEAFKNREVVERIENKEDSVIIFLEAKDKEPAYV